MNIQIGQITLTLNDGVVEARFPIGEMKFAFRVSRNTITEKVHVVVAAEGKVLLDQYMGGKSDTPTS